MNKTLTESQVHELLGRKIPTFMYQELDNVRNIDNLIDKNGAVLILYMTDMTQKMGHWTCLIRTVNNKGEIVNEVFDPYGTSVDRQFQYDSVVKMPRILSSLLANSRFPTTYNDFQFQRFQPGINTCGRHCAMRISMSHLPLTEYKKLLDSYKTDYDMAAVELTTK